MTGAGSCRFSFGGARRWALAISLLLAVAACGALAPARALAAGGDTVSGNINANYDGDINHSFGGVTVTAIDVSNAANGGQTVTAAYDGYYTFSGATALTNGDKYYFEFQYPGYQTFYYDENSGSCVSSPTTLNCVTTSQSQAAADASANKDTHLEGTTGIMNDASAQTVLIAASGTLEGTVTDAEATAANITSDEVEAYTANGSTSESTQLAANGSYAFTDLPTGSYYVMFEPGAATDTYESDVYYGGGTSQGSATLVSVTDGGATVTGIDGALTPNVGTISGSVAVPSSATLTNVSIDLYNAAGEDIETAGVSSGGAFSFTQLTPGSYYLRAYDTTSTDNVMPVWLGGAGSLAASTPVKVTAGAATSGISFALANGSTISVTVTGWSPSDLANSLVCAVPVAAVVEPEVWYTGCAGSAYPSPFTGVAELTGLPAGTYDIEVGGDDVNPNFLYSSSSGAVSTYDYGAATAVTVGAGATGPSITINAPQGGAIAGTVTSGLDGSPLAYTQVDVFDQWGNDIDACGYGCETGKDGNYDITGLFPGQYRLEFIPYDGLGDSSFDGSPLALQFYSGEPTLAAATPVVVAAGQTLRGINAVLGAGATVSGTVTDANSGAALGGILVELVDADGDYVAEAETLPTGAYSIPDVPAGKLYVEFVGGQAFNGGYYATAYYGNKPTLAGATAVTTSAGQTLSGIDGKLLGQSTAPAGKPSESKGSLTGLAKDKVALKFKLSAGSGSVPYLKSFTVKLPKGFSWAKKKLKKDLSVGTGVAHSYKLAKGKLTLTLTTAEPSVSFSIKAGGITVTKKIKKRAKKRKIKSEGITVSGTDVFGAATSLSFTVKKPH